MDRQKSKVASIVFLFRLLSITFLTDVFHHRHFVFNSWTTEIQQIADSIEKYAKDMFSLDESVDVSHPLNSLELAIFYGRKRIGWHRDQIYKNGLFQNAKNSQQENTFTYILVVGNTRPLEMQLFKDIAGKGASEVNSKQRCFYKIGRAHVRTPVTEKSRMPSSA